MQLRVTTVFVLKKNKHSKKLKKLCLLFKNLALCPLRCFTQWEGCSTVAVVSTGWPGLKKKWVLLWSFESRSSSIHFNKMVKVCVGGVWCFEKHHGEMSQLDSCWCAVSRTKITTETMKLQWRSYFGNSIVGLTFPETMKMRTECFSVKCSSCCANWPSMEQPNFSGDSEG